MSTVYHHDPAYGRDPMHIRGGAALPPHSRNISTLSAATVQSSSTYYSHPTEPLLPPSGSLGETYYDDSAATSRAELHASGQTRQAWPTSHPSASNRLNEKGGFATAKRAPTPQARSSATRWRWTKVGLELAIGGWAIYNAVRYFIAFTTYQSDVGQLVSLVLGVSSTLSCTFLIAALVFAWFQPRLIYHGVSPLATANVYWGLSYTSLFLLFAPAMINFALSFAWKNAEDLQLRMRYRCYVDVDVVWSRTDQLCKAKASTWGFWVVLSALRLAITLLAIIAYPIVLRKLRRITSIVPKQSRGKHRHNPSDAIFPHGVSQIPNGQTIADSGHRSETSLLSARAAANLGISHLSPRPLRFSRSGSSDLSATATSNITRSPASLHNPSQGYGHSGLYSSFTTPLSSLPEAAREGGGLGAHTDGFTSLVSQLHQETDAALQFARSEHTGSTKSHSTRSLNSSNESSSLGSPKLTHSDLWQLEEQNEEAEVRAQLSVDTGRPHRHPSKPQYQHANPGSPDGGESDDEDFYGSTQPQTPPANISPVVGYNEFGLPYPADEQIAMLNGYVRRMPTIESVGSREMGSSVAASSMLNRNSVAGSSLANRLSYGSRPPTRNTLLSMLSNEFDGSLGSKGEGDREENKHDSLNVQVERLAALGALTGTSTPAGDRPIQAPSPEPVNAFEGTRARRISEIGELQSVKSVKISAAKPSNSSLDVDLPNLVGRYEGGETGYLQSTGGSRNTEHSYYTATTGSGKDELLVGITTEGGSTVPVDGPTFFKASSGFSPGDRVRLDCL
ncbi:hypothetical protein BKA70DRAFT_1398147 [Coprinopsis sp. MPI-PUGE-AT-0042]|nr:hypothetical protein BKA70DRAFT_1398147 [Coprinopsis sp. MPI-PUGE-AT-0042]